MSDTAVRELRRRAQHDPSLRQPLLVARLRSGELTRERLELAAYCGNEDARAILPMPHLWAIPNDLRAWLEGLDRWVALEGQPRGAVHIRAATVAARLAYPAWARDEETCCCGSGRRGHGWGDGHSFTHACDYYGSVSPAPCECVRPWPLRAIEATEAWLADPTPERAQACWDALRLTGTVVIHGENESWWRTPAAMVPWHRPADDRAVAFYRDQLWSGAEVAALLCGSEYAADLGALWRRGQREVLNAIRAALAEWALGEV